MYYSWILLKHLSIVLLSGIGEIILYCFVFVTRQLRLFHGHFNTKQLSSSNKILSNRSENYQRNLLVSDKTLNEARGRRKLGQRIPTSYILHSSTAVYTIMYNNYTKRIIPYTCKQRSNNRRRGGIDRRSFLPLICFFIDTGEGEAVKMLGYWNSQQDELTQTQTHNNSKVFRVL